MSRLLWMLTTPRRLRRSSLIVLVVWAAIALAHQNGIIGKAWQQLPPLREIPVSPAT